MKKILFMCGMFHPNYSANGVCVKNVIDELIKQGYDITCLCNDYIGYTNRKDEIYNNCKIYRVRRRNIVKIKDYFEKKNMEFGIKIISLINKIAIFINSWRWPFISFLYTLRFYNKAKKLYLQNKYEFVISVYSPIDTLYAGYLLKKRFPNTIFIPYYLDALAGGWGPKRWSKEKIEKHTRKYEQRIDEVADIIVSMESSKKYHMNNEIENYNKKRVFLDVPLLKPNETIDLRTNNKNVKKYGLYAGNLSSSNRNINYILDFFLEFCNKTDFYFYLIGDTKTNDIFKKYEQLSKGKILYLGKKGREEVNQMEKNSFFLVSIGSNNENTVPGKIFEYFSFNKPIISTYNISNEPSIKYLKKYGKFFLLNETKPITDKTITEVNNFLLNSTEEKGIDIYKEFYNNMPTAFAELINNGGKHE